MLMAILTYGNSEKTVKSIKIRLAQYDYRTRDRPLRHLYHDWSIRLLCPPKTAALVGETRELANHDKDEVIVCHVLYSLLHILRAKSQSAIQLRQDQLPGGASSFDKPDNLQVSW